MYQNEDKLWVRLPQQARTSSPCKAVHLRDLWRDGEGLSGEAESREGLCQSVGFRVGGGAERCPDRSREYGARTTLEETAGFDVAGTTTSMDQADRDINGRGHRRLGTSEEFLDVLDHSDRDFVRFQIAEGRDSSPFAVVYSGKVGHQAVA